MIPILKIAKPILTLGVFCILLSGCDSGKPATISSAEKLRKEIVAEIQKYGPLTEGGKGSGQSGNIHTREFFYSIPSSSFNIEKIGTAVDSGITKWGEYQSYQSRGKGFGGTSNSAHSSIEYGNHTSHAFIDTFAVKGADSTEITFLIRVVE